MTQYPQLIPFTKRDPHYINDTNVIYLDNNGTTIMSKETIAEMVRWCNRGNPSSTYTSAKEATEMIEVFKTNLLKCINASVGEFTVIITSGATEANNMILKSVINSYTKIRGRVPAIVCSAVEHLSVIETLEQLNSCVDVSFVLPDANGTTSAKAFDAQIRENTCLAVCMHANNETGAINDIASIRAITRARNIPLFVDCVQMFGKQPLNVKLIPVDAITLSCHKFGGPAGVGALIVRNDFLRGYAIEALICGTQNNHLRGGTENVAGIGASLCALVCAMNDRANKNARLAHCKSLFIEQLASALPVIKYEDYAQHLALKTLKSPSIIIFALDNAMPNTVLLSVYNAKRKICNAKLKLALQASNIIVSIGSACNTANKSASHVLTALRADDALKRGTLRISFGDTNQAGDGVTVALAIIKLV